MSKDKLPRKLKKQIPEGPYCYKLTGKTFKVKSKDFDGYVTAYETKYCPLHFYNELGYQDCKYMVKKTGILNGQDDDLDFAMDDSCKCCNFKKGY